MNRLLKFTTLALFALMMTVTAFAQDALPLPAAADGQVTRAGITLIQPAMFGGISPTTIFKWSDTGAQKTTLVFNMIYTGQVYKWKPVIFCTGGVCQTQAMLPAAFFDITNDSSIVDWSIQTKVNGVVTKSEKRRLTIEEVTAPTPISPYNEQKLAVASVTSLVWQHPATAAKYKLVIKDYDTGALVLKQAVNTSACYVAVPYNKCQWAVTPGLLKANHHYVWWLVVTGVTGEKATSAKFHLLTH